MQKHVKHSPGFYLHIQQDGEGCDYTIGCGHRLVRLAAENVGEAHAESVRVWREYGAEEMVMHVLTVSHVYDMAGFVSGDLQRRAKERDAAERAEKLATIERLQRELAATGD